MRISDGPLQGKELLLLSELPWVWKAKGVGQWKDIWFSLWGILSFSPVLAFQSLEVGFLPNYTEQQSDHGQGR